LLFLIRRVAGPTNQRALLGQFGKIDNDRFRNRPSGQLSRDVFDDDVQITQARFFTPSTRR